MTASLTAKSALYIGGAVPDDWRHRNADLALSDFAGQDWLAIEKPEDLGRITWQGEASEHTTRRGGLGRPCRIKTNRRISAELVARFALAVHLPGQARLIEAETTGSDYAFRLRLADAPAGGAPSERLFIATVAALQETFGGPEDQPKLTAEFWINSVPLRIAAAPAP